MDFNTACDLFQRDDPDKTVQCRLCGCTWDTEEFGDHYILSDIPVCESCHDNFFGEFNESDYDHEHSTGIQTNKEEVEQWSFNQCVNLKQTVLGLKGSLGENVLFIASPSLEYIRRKFEINQLVGASKEG